MGVCEPYILTRPSSRLLQNKACKMEAGLASRGYFGNLQEMFIKKKNKPQTKKIYLFQHSRKHDPNTFICILITLYLEQGGKLSFANVVTQKASWIIFSNWKMVKKKVTKIC